MQNQIEKNRRRIALLLIQGLAAKTRTEKKRIGSKINYWNNQIRIAQAVQDKQAVAAIFN